MRRSCFSLALWLLIVTVGQAQPAPELVTLVTTTDGITPDHLETIQVLDGDPNLILFTTRNVGANCGSGTPAGMWRLALDPGSGEVASLDLVRLLDGTQNVRATFFENSTGLLFTGSGWCGPTPAYFSSDGGATWRAVSNGVHPPESSFSYAELGDDIFVGTGYEPYHGQVYRWLGGPGDDWSLVFDIPPPRSIVTSLTTYHDRLFVGSQIYWGNGCSSCAGSVPVYVSADGTTLSPTAGIPGCQTVEEHAMLVVDDTLMVLTYACGVSEPRQWYRWDGTQWLLHGTMQLEVRSETCRFPVTDGTAIYAYGQVAGHPVGFYRSADLGLTWGLIAPYSGPDPTSLHFHGQTLYAGTLRDGGDAVHLYRIACGGTTWHVPGDLPTIAAALDAANAGDTVLIACGTYFEHDLVLKPGVAVRSETGEADCVTIDAQQLGRVVQRTGSGAASLLAGLTLTGGVADVGGGVLADGGPLTIENCVVMDNAASVRGGGLAGVGAALTLTGCTIEGNAAPAGAGLAVSGGATAIDRTVIAQNQGSSIFCVGGVPQLSCSDLFGNTQGDWIGSFGDQVVLRGNFAADPCFCDDLHLCADSFCAPGQHPWGCDDLVGALGVGCGACGCLGPVATYLVQFAAHPEPGAVTLAWRTAHEAAADAFRVRASRDGEAWDVPVATADDGSFTACDESAHVRIAGPVYYNLDVATGPGAWTTLHGESVLVPASALGTRLTSAYPNPFNPRVTVAFTVGRPQQVRITIHDATGRLVAVVTDQAYDAGLHSAIWDGRGAPSGTYLVRLVTDDGVEARKLVLVR